MKLRITILFCVLFSMSWALAVENIKIFRPGLWDFSYDGQYYRTEANHTRFSDRTSLPSGNYYQLIDTTIGSRFIYSDSLAFYGSGNYAVAQSQSATGERSTPMFNRMTFGMEFKAFEGSFNIIPDISFIYPLEKVSNEMNDVMTSEGVNEIISKVYLQKRFGNFFGFGYLGFNYRSSGRSHLAPWGLGGDWYLGSLILGGEIYGFQSITHDNESDNPMNRDVTRFRVAGGSERFFSVDPSVIATQFFIKIQTSKRMQFKLGAGTTLFGDRYANGYNISTGLVYRFDFGSWYVDQTEKKNSSYIETPYSSERAIPRFEQDTEDGVDQDLFYPAPSKPRSQPRAVSPKKKLTSPSLAPQAADPNDESENSDDEDTDTSNIAPADDVQIKLKRKKKR